MSEDRALPADALCRRCDPATLPFETTAELADVPGIIGQSRAEEAVRFGIGIKRYGYNLYALGTSGMGKHGFVRAFLERRASAEPAPDDWAYVHDFADARRPHALRLPPGGGPALREDMRRLVDELRGAIPAVFDSEDYRTRRKLLEAQFSEAGEKAFAVIEERARKRGVAIVRAPGGIGFAPLRDGEVIEPAQFEKLPGPEQERRKAEMAAVQAELQEALAALPREAQRQRDELRRLDRLVTATATGQMMDEVRARWADVPAVLEHLAEVQKDIVDNAEDFLPQPESTAAVRPSSTRTTRPTPTSWAESSTSPSSATSSPTSRWSTPGRCTAQTAAT